MTAPTDQFIDITKRSQDAFTTVARTWADSMQSIAGAVLPSDVPVPSMQPYLDGFFDLAEKMLSEQRDLAHHWVNATLRATEVVTAQAVRASKTVAHEVADEAETVIDDSAQATRVNGEQAVQATKAISGELTNGAEAAVEKTALATTPATGVRTTSSGRAARSTPKS
jgi:conjugal transfer/entry exclusion protein